jgi:hypothetical protein
MKLNYYFSALLIGISIVVSPVFPARAQEALNKFDNLQTLLQRQKWEEANQETISLLRNNPQNLSCQNLSVINNFWMKQSNGKFGFTPQLDIWQKVGGDNCKTCEDQIKKFAKNVGWNLNDQIATIPGDYVGQYPTAVSLGWEHYIDTDRSLFRQSIFSGSHTWQAWKIGSFNLFSMLKKCQGKPQQQR